MTGLSTLTHCSIIIIQACKSEIIANQGLIVKRASMSFNKNTQSALSATLEGLTIVSCLISINRNLASVERGVGQAHYDVKFMSLVRCVEWSEEHQRMELFQDISFS